VTQDNFLSLKEKDSMIRVACFLALRVMGRFRHSIGLSKKKEIATLTITLFS